MINTSYVPLEHPYRIIEYNGTIGIQIGVLVVTKETESKDGRFAIETHSFPVVSYINNKVNKESVKRPMLLYFSNEDTEGVVWNNVEVSQVKTLVRENEPMKWSVFTDFCRNCKMYEIRNTIDFSSIHIIKAFSNLHLWGINVIMPEVKKGVLRLRVELYDSVIGAKAYCLGRGDLGLAIYSTNTKMMAEQIKSQVEFYSMFFMEYLDKIQLDFFTKEKRYKELAYHLNDYYRDGHNWLYYKEYKYVFAKSYPEEDLPPMMAAEAGPDEE